MCKNWIMVIAAFFLLSGCTLLPLPSGSDKGTDTGTPPSRPAAQEPVNAPITLYEALARAVNQRIDTEVMRMETALRQARTESPDFQRLKSLVHSAGYGEGPRPEGLETGGQERLADEMTTLWNILDFGILYTKTTGQPTPAGLQAEIRNKAFQNILQETRYAFYRAASAEQLLPEAESLLNRARAALQQSRQTVGQPSREELEQRRWLIEQVRILWDLVQRLTPVRSDLAVLMNLNPGTPFQIVSPDWNRPTVPTITGPMTALESIALVYRPELKEAAGGAGVGVYETRQALSRFQPGINFDERYDDSGFIPTDWRDVGFQVAQQLFSPEPAAAQRLPLNMAILTQVHLARQRYALAREAYQLSRMLGDVNARLNVRNGDTAALREDTETLIARMRYHFAFAEMENAAARIYAAVGLAPLPEQVTTTGTMALTRALSRSLHQWDNLLRSAQASAYAPSAQPAPGSSPGTGPFHRQSEPGESPPTAAAPPPAASAPETGTPRPFQQPGSEEIIDAAEALREGRKVPRKISIFRDVVTIHFSPSYQSPVKGQGLIGEEYPLLAWTRDGWLKIEMGDGSAGWIPSKYIRPVDEADEEMEPQEAVAEETPEGWQMIITTTRSNVRSDPNLDSAVLYIEEEARRFIVLGQRGEWYKVRTRTGGEGWLHESVIRVLAEGE